MHIIEIPYDLLEKILGPTIASNYNKITAVIFVIALTVYVIRHDKRTQKKPKIETTKEKFYFTRNGKRLWYPTGWYYNEEKERWEAPDYIKEESHRKWTWDEDKKIWIDQDKKQQLERYQKFREGKPPTFEEWKAQQEADNSNLHKSP